MDQGTSAARLSLFSLHMVWRNVAGGISKHTYNHLLEDTKEDGFHAFSCFSHLLENEVFTIFPWKKIIMFADNGPHFHCQLFWLYLDSFCIKHKIEYFELNYHEPGEGRCYLDRYFGSLTCTERTFMLQNTDIQGTSQTQNVLLISSGTRDYLEAWSSKQNSTFYLSTLNRKLQPFIINELVGGPKRPIRQLIFCATGGKIQCRLVRP